MHTETKTRCPWCLKFPEYIQYHDEEWGVPVHDDRKHFEFLVLEAAQAGLSWATVLKKRQGYSEAFANFDPAQVATFPDSYLEEILKYGKIVRNRLKVYSTVNNARRFLELQKEFGSFDRYIWQFVDNKPILNHWKTLAEVPATTPASDALSKDLKKRGFKFVGSTVIYAHMQACGLVNDHLVDCWRYDQVNR